MICISLRNTIQTIPAAWLAGRFFSSIHILVVTFMYFAFSVNAQLDLD